MAISKEMRRLQTKWASNQGWPKRLEYIEISGLRGWQSQRVEFQFPIVAIAGENGSGKSTIIQSAASVYRGTSKKTTKFASDFFPSTAWDKVSGARIRYSYKEGTQSVSGAVSRPTTRWLGNPDRPLRNVVYIDLSRLIPVSARLGYSKIAKSRHKEVSAKPFEDPRVGRLSEIMGKHYDSAKMATTNIDIRREVPVVAQSGSPYSGFHQGAGEMTMLEFLRYDIPEYSLVLIDEIETSLHPRAQRRLMRDLADRCRDQNIQVILTTHSPYILEELPPVARMYILETGGKKELVSGVSPAFAMTRMDDEPHPECDVYVEDEAALALVSELLAAYSPLSVRRCKLIPFGSSQVGIALGQMIEQKRFPRPSVVFLDGDTPKAPGCNLLPGQDAPEIVVFEGLKAVNWGNLAARLSRSFADVADACDSAMTIQDHHEWVRASATKLTLAGHILWQLMCSEWAKLCLDKESAKPVITPVEDGLAAAG